MSARVLERQLVLAVWRARARLLLRLVWHRARARHASGSREGSDVCGRSGGAGQSPHGVPPLPFGAAAWVAGPSCVASTTEASTQSVLARRCVGDARSWLLPPTALRTLPHRCEHRVRQGLRGKCLRLWQPGRRKCRRRRGS
jgi:hypothetical protein